MTPYIGNRFLSACCAELHVTDEEMMRDFETCATHGFLPASEADEILTFCKARLHESKRIKLPPYNNESRQSSKIICADVDGDGWFPQCEFANMTAGNYSLRQSAIIGTPLEPLCQKITAEFYAGSEHTFNVVINCHRDNNAYTPSHKDQPSTTKSKSEQFETVGDIFVFSVGADRLFTFFKDIGGKGSTGLKTRGEVEVLYDVRTEHNSLCRLTGKLNAACFHAVFQHSSAGGGGEMRFGVTVRVTERLFVNVLLGEYRIYKKGAWTTRKLPALDDSPPPTPGEDGAPSVPLDGRKRQFESMSKDELVDLVMQTDLQPQSKERGGAPSGGAPKRPKRAEQKKAADAAKAPFPDMPEICRVSNMQVPELCHNSALIRPLGELLH